MSDEDANQIDRHTSTIKEILDAHALEVQKLTTTLARRESVRANITALKIEKAINASGAQLPIPIIPNEKLNDLFVLLLAKRKRAKRALQNLGIPAPVLPNEERLQL